MELWQENDKRKKIVIPNEEVIKRFKESKYYKHRYEEYRNTGNALVCFITAKDGLNSTWEWEYKKGSIEGSKDMILILNDILK